MAKILIVDDSIVMRKNLKYILTSHNHTIIGEAVNGKQAVNMYANLKPDLVTMDISMPVMQGIDAVKEIIKDFPEAKIIVISALNQKHMIFEALKNGAKHYIIKPIEADKVINIVNEVLYNDNEENTEVKSNINKDNENYQEEQGFSINNNNGIFEIELNKHFGLKDQIALDTALKGLLFIKPLKVKFVLDDEITLTEEIIKTIQKQVKTIKKADAEIFLDGNLSSHII